MQRLSALYLVFTRQLKFKKLPKRLDLLLLILCAAVQLGASDQKSNPKETSLSPSLDTDQNSYPPGSEVHITGSGFLSGETVTLTVSLLDSYSAGGEADEPWDVSASNKGGFTSYWAVPDNDALEEVFKVTATGKTSKRQATAFFADANVQLSLTTNLPDTLCPGERIEVCANLSQQCGGGLLTPLPGRELIFYANAGDCGANVGQNGEDTIQTDTDGNACFTLSVPDAPGEFALRVKFQGEDRPEPCPEVGNNACNPTDPLANKRCTNLSTANVCATYIVDTIACGCGEPIINCPSYVTQANEPGQCGAPVFYSVEASGKCGPTTTSCSPSSGSFFLVGTTAVLCTATDTAGNSASCSFPVSVQDTEAPQFFCPENIAVHTGSNQDNGVPVSYSAVAVDNCASPAVVCTPPSGSLFPTGVTAVTCTASDASRNSSACSFTVTLNSLLFFQRSGAFAGDQLGFSVAGGGDVNGDGFADFLVSIPGADGGAAGNSAVFLDAGSVEVFSGADGSLLYQADGSSGGDRLGGSVGIQGDVNNDGLDDFIVGAPYADANGMVDAGAAYVYSGAGGTLLYTVGGAAESDRLGGSVGILADVNGDGKDEFLVGAPGYDVGGTGEMAALPDAGAVYVYSGVDGSLLYQVTGTGAGDGLGGTVGVSGDVNADGTGDFIVGAPEADPNGLVDAGAAYVYSGTNGQLVYEIDGGAAGDRLGSSVGISGDVNADGKADFIVGAPFEDIIAVGGAALKNAGAAAALEDAGAAYVYSGADGGLLYEIDGSGSGDRLGGSVGISGPVNGDLYDDFFVAAPEADPNGLVDAGQVTVYSGSNGQTLMSVDGGTSGDRLGGSAGAFESTGGGGSVRIILGAPGAEAEAGAAFVYQIAHKGDLNGDGRLSAADIYLLLNCIFLQQGYCPLEITDLNCDGSAISPSDVVILLNAAFLEMPVTCVQY
ncbi:MAG: HYR domain-containing protein [candidate division Zixibacteria bacterium]|nr:HYR domain-containing protein [candidate division Zixibacteria bacterium]